MVSGQTEPVETLFRKSMEAISRSAEKPFPNSRIRSVFAQCKAPFSSLKNLKRVPVELLRQLVQWDDRGTYFFHDQSSGDVRDMGGLLQIQARCQRSCDRGEHRVAGAGYVVNFSRGSSEMRRFLTRSEKGHTVFALRDQHRFEIEAINKHPPCKLGGRLAFIDVARDSRF